MLSLLPLPVVRSRFCKAPRASSDGHAGRGSDLRIAGLISLRSIRLLTVGRQKVSRLFIPRWTEFHLSCCRGVVGFGPVVLDDLGSSLWQLGHPYFQARPLSLRPLRQSGCPFRTICVSSPQGRHLRSTSDSVRGLTWAAFSYSQCSVHHAARSGPSKIMRAESLIQMGPQFSIIR